MKTEYIILSLLNLASSLKSSKAPSFSLDTLVQYFKVSEDISVDVDSNHRCLSFTWMLSNASTLARMCISKVMLQANHKEEKAGSVRRLTCMQHVYPKQEAWSHSQHLGWQLQWMESIRDSKKATVRSEVFHTCYTDYKHTCKTRRSSLWVSYGGALRRGPYHQISACTVIGESSFLVRISSAES